jgi:hypothetical protein
MALYADKLFCRDAEAQITWLESCRAEFKIAGARDLPFPDATLTPSYQYMCIMADVKHCRVRRV